MVAIMTTVIFRVSCRQPNLLNSSFSLKYREIYIYIYTNLWNLTEIKTKQIGYMYSKAPYIEQEINT